MHCKRPSSEVLRHQFLYQVSKNEPASTGRSHRPLQRPVSRWNRVMSSSTLERSLFSLVPALKVLTPLEHGVQGHLCVLRIHHTRSHISSPISLNDCLCHSSYEIAAPNSRPRRSEVRPSPFFGASSHSRSPLLLPLPREPFTSQFTAATFSTKIIQTRARRPGVGGQLRRK